jgi:nicotinic acid mononucleotide adenylyltransferase
MQESTKQFLDLLRKVKPQVDAKIQQELLEEKKLREKIAVPIVEPSLSPDLVAHLNSCFPLVGISDVVLLITGSFNPAHTSHIRMAAHIKQQLEHLRPGCRVVAALWSPSHDSYVRGKLGNDAIAAAHRITILQTALMAEPSVQPWGFVYRAEVDAPKILDFPTVTALLQSQLDSRYGANRFQATYFCGADHAARCNLFRGFRGHRVVILPRPGTDLSGHAIDASMCCVVAPLPADMAPPEASSTAVRQAAARQDLATLGRLLGPAVLAYIRSQRLWGLE